MLRQAEKSFASNSLHIQIEALGTSCGIPAPGEGDSGAIRGEGRRSRLSGQSGKRKGGEHRLLWRPLVLMPSITNYGSKSNENTCAARSENGKPGQAAGRGLGVSSWGGMDALGDSISLVAGPFPIASTGAMKR